MTSTNTPHLRALPRPRTEPDPSGCSVVCQAKLSGPQPTSVRVLTPVTGPGDVLIAVRVGGILLLMSDLEALRSLGEVVALAEGLAPGAFGSAP